MRLLCLFVLSVCWISVAAQSCSDLEDQFFDYAEKEDYRSALNACKKAISYGCSNPAWWHEKAGRAAWFARDYEEALSSFSNALEYKPNDPDLLNYRALIYLSLNEWEKAGKDCSLALELGSTDDLAYNNCCIAFRNQGNYMKALNYINQAINMNPNDPLLLYQRAMTWYRAGEYEEVLKDVDKVLEIEPNEADALNLAANIYKAWGQYEKAIDYYDRVLEADDDNYMASFNLGNVFIAKGDYPLALLYYEISLLTQQIAALNGVRNLKMEETEIQIALTYRKMGNLDSALIFADLSIKENSYYPLAYQNKGVILYEMDRLDEAIENFNKALDLDYENPEKSHYMLGWCYMDKDQPYKALVQFEKALTLREDWPNAKKGKLDAEEAIAKEENRTFIPKVDRLEVFWVQPEPGVMSEVMRWDQPDLPIKLLVISNTGSIPNENDIEVYVNGYIQEGGKANERRLFSVQSQTFIDETIKLNPGSNVIKVKVKLDGQTAETQTIEVYYNTTKPDLHVLVIGTKSNLKYTQKDAQDIAGLFSNQADGNKLFSNVHLHQLIGEDATASAISKEIERMKVKYQTQNMSDRDMVVVFLSGHGILYDGSFRICGSDFEPGFEESTTVAYDHIKSILSKVYCKKLVFMDACHSGGAKAPPEVINAEIANLNTKSTAMTVIASSRESESSYEDDVWQNGAFTKTIVEALQSGSADQDANDVITIDELFSYMEATIPPMVKQVKNQAQHPMLVNSGLGNVGIYVVK
jgi:tetratricopeptide (TPR) repeat protein